MCNGASFDTTKYPKLHNYLSGLAIYPNRGYLPNFDDRWLGQVGTNNGSAVGKFKDSMTAKPNNDFVTNNAGSHSHKTVGMNNRKMSAAPNTGRECIRPYGTGDDASPEYPTDSHPGHTHKIASGGDTITRPPTVVGRWIIKHD